MKSITSHIGYKGSRKQQANWPVFCQGKVNIELMIDTELL